MMSLWDALRMNMMISYQELVRTFLSFALRLPLLILAGIGRAKQSNGKSCLLNSIFAGSAFIPSETMALFDTP
ncbi:Uncharacterised protein [Enterobacter hormaechei]|nr:Uncharacterised protein [Enterobacter hormaechei]